jgi:hypothetical protein
MPGSGGILSAAIEHAANPAEPIEAFGLTRRLMELYPGRLYLELAFHGNSAEKLVNRGLIAIAQRMERMQEPGADALPGTAPATEPRASARRSSSLTNVFDLILLSIPVIDEPHGRAGAAADEVRLVTAPGRVPLALRHYRVDSMLTLKSQSIPVSSGIRATLWVVPAIGRAMATLS